ncbi:MAG: hypothetical protein Kow00127_02630 [Bacteroidales bacterium]
MMKKIIYIPMVLALLVLAGSCQKELTDPKLDMSQTVPPAMIAPADGSSFVLTPDAAEEVMTTFEWSPTIYNISGLEATKYSVDFAPAGTNFEGAANLYSGTETAYPIKVGAMNQLLIGLGYSPDSAYTFDFKITSHLNDLSEYSYISSEVVSYTFTPYADVVEIKPVYLLGEATPVGWDNGAALPMAHIGDGRFARVETLDPALGIYWKIISQLGAWAPQWGTDETGTPEAGPLVYRPDEDTPDPAAIPAPDVVGDYYIEVDTALLTYKTFLTSGELYLVGSATTVGWDNTAGLPFTEVEPHIFEITTNLTDGGMKFLEVLGQWAPQWGTDETATGAGGPLIFRPEESVPDPAEVPSPGSGTYTIRVDLTAMSYTIEAK